MKKTVFGQFISADGKVIKICPKCRTDILPEWVHAYEHEWCPSCGLNLDEVRKEDIIK